VSNRNGQKTKKIFAIQPGEKSFAASSINSTACGETQLSFLKQPIKKRFPRVTNRKRRPQSKIENSWSLWPVVMAWADVRIQ